MGKSKTSSEVKNRWNAKTYDRISVSVRKDVAEEYRAKCEYLGIPLSKVLHKAIEAFLKE